MGADPSSRPRSSELVDAICRDPAPSFEPGAGVPSKVAAALQRGLFDERLDCLDRRRQALAGLLDEVLLADADTLVRRSPELVAARGALARGLDPEQPRRVAARPRSPRRRRAGVRCGAGDLERSLASDDPRIALPLKGLGLIALAEGRFELARERLEQALSRVDGASEPQELADLRFALARALRGAKLEPERAIELAEQARASFDALGLAGRRDAVTAWLASPP